MTDLDLAKLQLNTYTKVPDGEIIDQGIDRAVITRQPGLTVVSIRGTVNPKQWISDFRIRGVRSTEHPQIGVCEEGFLAGAEALFPAINSAVTGDVIIQGHSRGAGMVPILAAMLTLDGLPPSRCVMWEAP